MKEDAHDINPAPNGGAGTSIDMNANEVIANRVINNTDDVIAKLAPGVNE